MPRRQPPVVRLAATPVLALLLAPITCCRQLVETLIGRARRRTQRLDIELRYTLPATADAALASIRTWEL